MKYFYVFILCLIGCSSNIEDIAPMYSSVYYERVDNKIVVKKDGVILLNYLPTQTKMRSNHKVFFTLTDTIVYFQDFKKKKYDFIGVNRILENKHNDSILVLQKYNNEILRVNIKTGDTINKINSNDAFLSLDSQILNEEYDDSHEEYDSLNLLLHTKDSIFKINKFYTTEKINLDTTNSYHFYQDFSYYDLETNSFIYWFYLRDKNGGEIRLYDLNEESKKSKLIFCCRDLFFITGDIKFKKFNNSYFLSNSDSIFLVKNNELHFLLNFNFSNLDWYPALSNCL